jgi:hypothetical protein
MERNPSELPGMRGNPWVLKTPDGTVEFRAFRDVTLDPPSLVVQVGRKEIRYHLRCLDDLYEMLKGRGGWVALGGAEEQEPAAPDSVEAWARSPRNPVGGWYGVKKGQRGGFAVYVPPIMQVLNLAAVDTTPPSGRMRAV